MSGGGQWASRKNMYTIRIVRMVVGVAAIALVLLNILFVESVYVSFVVIVLIVVWIALTAGQMYYLSRMRRRNRGGQGFNDGAQAGLDPR